MAGDSGVPVRIEVTEILVGGTCPLGIEPGRVWVVADGFLPEGLCAAAWNSIQPYVYSLRYGGAMPWNGERQVSLCCPDASNPVVFKITVMESGDDEPESA